MSQENTKMSHNLKTSVHSKEACQQWIVLWYYLDFSLQKSGKTEKPKAEKPKAEQKPATAKGKVEKAAKPAETKPKPAAAANVAKEATKKGKWRANLSLE